MNADAVAKISMLKGSMRCLLFGLLGLSPFAGLPFTLFAFSTGLGVFGLLGVLSLAGLPFACLALLIGGRVRRQEKKYWNAGKPLRIWGVVCGGAGAVMWVIVAGLFAYAVIVLNWPYSNQYGDD